MKALLLADVPPCVDYTAGIALTELCAACPPDSVVSCALMTVPDDGRVSDRLSWLKVERHHLPPPYSRFNHWPGLGTFANFLHNSLIRFPNIDRLLPKVLRLAEQCEVDRLWCVLESDPVIRLTARLAKELRVPLYTHVYDPPEWWLRACRFDRFSRNRVLRAFDEAIAMSHRCATVSWNMAEDYRRQYNVETVTVLPCLDRSLAAPRPCSGPVGDQLTIAIAGQLYAADAWESLLSALDSVNWGINGRQVVVRVYGRADATSTPGRHIEYCGWRDQASLINELATCDILYCPYWFDPAFEKEARHCFPSKLAAYTAAGRPILVHAPQYACPVQFVTATHCGLCCHTKDPKDVLGTIQQLASDCPDSDAYGSNARLAFDAHLNTEAVADQFRTFLDVDMSPLHLTSARKRPSLSSRVSV